LSQKHFFGTESLKNLLEIEKIVTKILFCDRKSEKVPEMEERDKNTSFNEKV
jgi:hypothetical protein